MPTTTRRLDGRNFVDGRSLLALLLAVWGLLGLPSAIPGEEKPAGQAGANVPEVGFGSVRTAADRRVRLALERDFPEVWEDTTLGEWAEIFGEKLGVRVVLDRECLEAEGLSGDTPFAFDARSQPAGLALRREMAKLHLRAMPWGGMLRIVSETFAERPENLVIGIYTVEDLLPRPVSDDPRSVTAVALVELVRESCGERGEWTDQGGESRLRFFAVDGLECLVVRADTHTHLDIEELLADLRAGRDRSRARPAGKAEEDFAIGSGTIRTAAERRLRQALARTFDEAWEDTTLGDWAVRLEGKLGVPVVLDEEGLDAEGISGETPFDFRPRGQRLEDALPRLLKPYGLAAYPQRGVLVVTAGSNEYDFLMSGTYDIGDFMPPPNAADAPQGVGLLPPRGSVAGLLSPGGVAAGMLAPPGPPRESHDTPRPDLDSRAPRRADELAELTALLCGEPAAWDDQGGPATLRTFAVDGYVCLRVRAPFAAHRDLEELLAGLRRMRQAAEPQKQAARGDTPPVGFGMIRTEADRKVRLALDRTLAGTWPEMSLGAWAVRLEAQLGIPVVLDERALADRALSSDARFVFAPQGQRLRDALPRALAKVSAAFLPERGLLRIVPDVDLEEYAALRWGLYDVRDLADAATANDFLQLILRRCGDRADWDEGGGASCARFFAAEGLACLAVKTLPSVHCEIEDLLFDLRALRAKRPRPAGPVAPQLPAVQPQLQPEKHVAAVPQAPQPLQPVPAANAPERRPAFVLPEPPIGSGLVRTQADLDLRRALDRPFPDPSPFPDGKLTLFAWAAHLEKALGCPVVLDRRALDAEGWTEDQEFEPSGRGETYRDMLDLELAAHDCAAVPADGVLRITSRDESLGVAAMTSAAYDVRDLLIRTHADGDRTIETADLLELVTENCGLPGGWAHVGGQGYVDFFTVDGLDCLVLRNTPAAHRDLEILLAQLRFLRRPVPHALSPAILPDRPRLPPVVGVGTARTRADSVLRLALERYAPSPPAAETTLAEWAADFERHLGSPVKLDLESLAEADLDGKTPVRALGGTLRLRERATATLGPLKLVAIPGDGTLRIVTAETALDEANHVAGTYDVRDLLHRTDPYGKRRPVAAADEFVTLVKSHCGRSIVWDDFGGSATAEFGTRDGVGRLTVRAPFDTHLQLEQLLAALRNIRDAPKLPPARPHARQWAYAPSNAFAPFRVREGNPFQGEPAEPEPEFEASSDPAPALEDDASRRAAAAATNAFGLNLYRQALDELPPRGTVREPNVMISPYATAAALGTFVGNTEGELAETLAERLHPGRTAAEHLAGLEGLRRSLPFDRGWERCLTVAAGKVWVRPGLAAQPEYVRRLRERLDFEFGSLNFEQPAAAATAIDSWIRKSTRGLIPSGGTTAADLPPDTALFLTSALTFEGEWQRPFFPTATRRKPFFAFETELRLPLMQSVDKFRHAVTAEAEWLRLPYGSGTLEMWVILPINDRAAWRKAAETLTPENLTAVAASARERKVEILLPWLKLDLRLELIPLLRKLGLKDLFDATHPFVLPGIGTRDPVSLRVFRQQARLEIDERGTRAAVAVQGGGAFGGIVVEDKPHPFHVDHPFHFVIRDSRTGLLLFVGGITNPDSTPPLE